MDAGAFILWHLGHSARFVSGVPVFPVVSAFFKLDVVAVFGDARRIDRDTNPLCDFESRLLTILERLLGRYGSVSV